MPDYKNGNLQPAHTVILVKVVEGDSNAFAILVKKYWPKVFCHAISYTKNYSTAEELTQDVFIQIWNKRHLLDEVKEFDNYLFIVSRNLIVSHLRKNVLVNEQNIDLINITNNSLNQYDLETKELNSLIIKAISSLPEPRRSIFKMSRIEERSADEICQFTGLSKRTIRWHLLQATNYIRLFIHRSF